MKLREMKFRELENGQLGEYVYPFTSEENSDWNDLQELGEHLFSPLAVVVSGQWVTTFETDDNDEIIEESKKEYIFPQF